MEQKPKKKNRPQRRINSDGLQERRCSACLEWFPETNEYFRDTSHNRKSCLCKPCDRKRQVRLYAERKAQEIIQIVYRSKLAGKWPDCGKCPHLDLCRSLVNQRRPVLCEHITPQDIEMMQADVDNGLSDGYEISGEFYVKVEK